jgi:hypothetical protein
MMDKSKTPPTHLGSCRYLTLCRGVLDLSIIQLPFSITKCTNLSITIRNFFIAAYWLCANVRFCRHRCSLPVQFQSNLVSGLIKPVSTFAFNFNKPRETGTRQNLTWCATAAAAAAAAGVAALRSPTRKPKHTMSTKHM